MATYGSLPGVVIQTENGSPTEITLGNEQYLVLIGVGDNSVGEASVNEVVTLDGQSDVDRLFGADTDIADAYRTALANGANPNFIKGIMAETTESTESFTATSTGTLSNAPIIARDSRVSAIDAANNDAPLRINFVYEDTVESPTESDVINVNPHTGDWEATGSPDVDISYHHADWATAIHAAENAFLEREFGVLHPLTSAESATAPLTSVVNKMRDQFKLAVGVQAAPPTGTENGHPYYNPSTYTDNVDDDAIFLTAPATQADRTPAHPNFGHSVAPAVAGLMAGNPNTEPIYDDSLAGVGDLAQHVTQSDVRTLANSYVMPVRDRSVPRVKRNRSTYAQEVNGGWTRDFFRRRIVDLTLAAVHGAAEQETGGVLRQDTPLDVDEVVREELGELVTDGLLEEGGQQVNVYRKNRETLGIDLSITPYGVTKSVDATLTIDA